MLINGFLLAAALVPFSHQEHYLVRGWDFPRFQLWIAATVSLLLQTFIAGWPSAGWWIVGILGLAAWMIQTIWILPYTPCFPCEVAATAAKNQKSSLRILAANVLQTNRRASDLWDQIQAESPDIVVLLEADDWWCDAFLPLEKSGYVHTLLCPRDNLYGMAVFSRLVLKGSKVEYLVSPEVPSMSTRVVLRSGEEVACHWVHPAPPSPTENEESTERDAELVLIGRRAKAEKNIPTIVAGDLNDVAWSSTTRLFRKISGLLDPRVGRGFYNSFHAKLPGLRWPLDHVFHSSHFTLTDIRCLVAFGSDHFPLLIELQLASDPPVSGESPECTEEDESRAREKVAAAREE